MVDALSHEVIWVRASKGEDWEGKDRRFASNGMSVCFERGRIDIDTGLLEVATPECEGPEALVLRLRAIDDQLERALPLARAWLEERGLPGTLSLVKNSRDDEGAFYGRQENIEVEFAGGGWLALWRIGLLILLPISFISCVLMVLCLMVRVVALMHKIDPDTLADLGVHPAMGRAAMETIETHLRMLNPLLVLAEFVGYRRQRGPLEGFLISRQCVAGTGWLDEEGRFVLSEKGAGINAWFSRDARPSREEHAVFSTGNLLKLVMLKNRITSAFSGRQRLQLGSADSNRCEVAEVLAISSTAAVVACIEAGGLTDAPRFDDPVSALHGLSDPSLQAEVADTTGRTWTAIELQRFYQQRCAAHEPGPVMDLWGEVLDGLETEPDAWIGRLDWVTKRWLLDQCADDAPDDVRKRIDIGYHELGPAGFYGRIHAAVQPAPLLDPDAVAEAARTAPSGPAAHRAALIAEHGDALAAVDWGRVQLRDKVIFLNQR